MTQRQLATVLERPHSVIGMIESHQRQVNVPEFIAIAKAVGADPAELFSRVIRLDTEHLRQRRFTRSRK